MKKIAIIAFCSLVSATQVHATPQQASTIAAVIPVATYFVAQGQTPIAAIRQWLNHDHIHHVAWAIPNAVFHTLNTPSKNGLLLTGNMRHAITQLGEKIGSPLYFSQNAHDLAAIHTLNGAVNIQWVHGKTLKAAIKNLTDDYQWHWTQGNKGSWMAADNYPLLAPYPIVTPRGDFAAALNTVLDGYPVKAELLSATKTIFIVGKE